MPELKVPTEVFTRVSGFYRPISQFNPGKKSEVADRIYFKIPEEIANAQPQIRD